MNVALYAPVGYLWFATLARRFDAGPAGAITVLAAGAMSLGIEVLQGWLPSRVPSNLDLLCNLIGAAGGVAVAIRWGHRWADRTAALPGNAAAGAASLRAGGALVLAWALVQLSPDNVLFSTGPGGNSMDWKPFDASWRLGLEGLAVAASALCVALLAMHVMAGTRLDVLGRLLAGTLLVLIAKAAVAAIAFGFARAFDWLSAGALWGTLAATGAILLASFLPQRARLALALAALATGTAAMLLLPPSLYAPSPIPAMSGSPVRNFAGALGAVELAWPLLAFAYLAWQLASYNETRRSKQEADT